MLNNNHNYRSICIQLVSILEVKIVEKVNDSALN